MGVQNFLPNVLNASGRSINLCHYADVYGPDRSLRVAIDVSSVVYKATQGFADMLTDERHLDNYGRTELLNQERLMAADGDEDNAVSNHPIYQKQVEKYALKCTMYVMKYLQKFIEAKIDILVVFDGKTPPIKDPQVRQRFERRKVAEAQRNAPVDMDDNNDDNVMKRVRASRRAGAGKHFGIILDSIIQALRQNQIPFLVSPYESDGQLAFLSVRRFVDLIVTEDSDLIACGASPILYKVSMKNNKDDQTTSNDGIDGVLLRMEDLACARTLDLMDVSSAMLATIFVAAGSDYCESLKGIGIKTACDAARKAFHADPRKGPPLANFLKFIYNATYDKSKLTDEYKKQFEKQFLGAVLMYRHPVVYNPVTGRCECFRLDSPDPELVLYEPYADLLNDESARSLVVGELIPSPMAAFLAEGWLKPRSLKPREYAVFPDYVDAFYKDLCKSMGRSATLSTPSKCRPTSITTALFSVEDPLTISAKRTAARAKAGAAENMEGRRLHLEPIDLGTQQESANNQEESQPDSFLSQMAGMAVGGQESNEMELETQPMVS